MVLLVLFGLVLQGWGKAAGDGWELDAPYISRILRPENLLITLAFS